MTPLEEFKADIEKRVADYPDNQGLQDAKRQFFNQIGLGGANYVFNFTWLGVPIIQIPQDLQAIQEMIWEVKPDLIIETGIAWGGSLMFSATMLCVLEACGEIDNGHIVAIDIDIRDHNKQVLENHPLAKKMTLIEASSIEQNTIDRVAEIASGYKRVMVFLDSNHTHEHVLAELHGYAPMVTKGSYCMVADTVIEDAPDHMNAERPWGKGNSPKSAIWQYLKDLESNPVKARDGDPLRLEMDKLLENKIVLTGSPDGYLKRV